MLHHQPRRHNPTMTEAKVEEGVLLRKLRHIRISSAAEDQRGAHKVSSPQLHTMVWLDDHILDRRLRILILLARKDFEVSTQQKTRLDAQFRRIDVFSRANRAMWLGLVC